MTTHDQEIREKDLQIAAEDLLMEIMPESNYVASDVVETMKFLRTQRQLGYQEGLERLDAIEESLSCLHFRLQVHPHSDCRLDALMAIEGICEDIRAAKQGEKA